MAENDWRDVNCPEYGYLYCEPCSVPPCEGAWYCDDIETITNDIFVTYNTNGGLSLDEAELGEHFDLMAAECDNNNDGNIDECEIFECVLNVENEWRQENCPWFSDLYCEK